MNVSYVVPDFARVLTRNVYDLETETDLTFVTRDGAAVHSHKLALFFAFPLLKHLTR